MKKSTYLGLTARRMAPTNMHRPAIWENMLGTVMAASPTGEVKYFDYDHEAAKAHAGVASAADLRLAKVPAGRRFYGDAGPRVGKLALWVK